MSRHVPIRLYENVNSPRRRIWTANKLSSNAFSFSSCSSKPRSNAKKTLNSDKISNWFSMLKIFKIWFFKTKIVSSEKPISWKPTKQDKVLRTASGSCLIKTFAISKTGTGASGSLIQTIWKSLSTNANVSQANTSRRRRCCSSWSKRKRKHSPKKIERYLKRKITQKNFYQIKLFLSSRF